MSSDSQHYVDLLRRMRHGYANQIQVLSGWLELSDLGRAREALADLRTTLRRDQMVLHQPAPEAALYLYACIQGAADMGMVLVCEDLVLSAWASLQRSGQPLTELHSIRQEYGREELVVYLSVAEREQNIHLQFTIEGGGSRQLTVNAGICPA